MVCVVVVGGCGGGVWVVMVVCVCSWLVGGFLSMLRILLCCCLVACEHEHMNMVLCIVKELGCFRGRRVGFSNSSSCQKA